MTVQIALGSALILVTIVVSGLIFLAMESLFCAFTLGSSARRTRRD